jgi:formylmethanofuran dehydrogenase subunit B
MKQELQTTCPFCSLHCADLRLTIDGGRLTRFSPPCRQGRSGYVEALEALVVYNVASPRKPSLRTARRLLQSSRRLLVVLSADASNEAVESAIRLAKDHSAVLAIEEESGSLLSLGMRSTGFLTGTLGELRSLEEVLLCGVEPARSHPRLGEIIHPADPFEALRWLRLGLLEGSRDIPPKFTAALAHIKAASSGVVFFGPAWLTAGQPLATELLLWLRDLNRHERWYAQSLSQGVNSLGVTETLLSASGYASGINFADAPGFSSPRWQAVRLIEEGWPDLCLLVGQPRSFTEQILTRLQKIRTILIDPLPPTWKPPLWLPVAQAGIDTHGSMKRLDGLPVTLAPILSSTRLRMETILDVLVAEDQP